MKRYGVPDDSTDHNSFFDNFSSTIAGTTDIEEIGSVSIDTSTKTNSDTQMNIYQMFKLLISKSNAMQEQLIRIETKIDNPRNQEVDVTKGVIDTVKLNNLGLPVKTKNELDSFEANLNDEIKRKEIVRFSLKIFLFFFTRVIMIMFYSN